MSFLGCYNPDPCCYADPCCFPAPPLIPPIVPPVIPTAPLGVVDLSVSSGVTAVTITPTAYAAIGQGVVDGGLAGSPGNTIDGTAGVPPLIGLAQTSPVAGTLGGLRVTAVLTAGSIVTTSGTVTVQLYTASQGTGPFTASTVLATFAVTAPGVAGMVFAATSTATLNITAGTQVLVVAYTGGGFTGSLALSLNAGFLVNPAGVVPLPILPF